MITAHEKALLHMYPAIAGLSDPDRRDVLMHAAGVTSTADPRLGQPGFEAAMAAYEQILWDRVDRQIIADPRACTVCGRPMTPGRGKTPASCPEGCGTRFVKIWSRDYWRRKAPACGMANSRQVWKLRQIWGLLQDYLPDDHRSDAYLAGIIQHSSGTTVAFEPGCAIAWHRLTSQQAFLATEALKDRLRYAVKQSSQVPF